MPFTTLSSRKLNQNVSKASTATRAGPVFITDRGKPAHDLPTLKESRQVIQRWNIADALAMPDGENIEFDPPRADLGTKPADLS